MKGLWINNMFSVRSTLTWTILSGILFGCIILISILAGNDVSGYLRFILLIQIGSFVGLTGTALEKENSCKWALYQQTLPISQKDIVQARYLSFLTYSGIGMLMMVITACLAALFANDSSLLQELRFSYEFGFLFGLVVPAFLYPMILRYGSDKLTLFLLLAVALTISVYFIASVGLGTLMQGFAHIELFSMLAVFFGSITIYYGSYRISIHIQNNR